MRGLGRRIIIDSKWSTTTCHPKQTFSNDLNQTGYKNCKNCLCLVFILTIYSNVHIEKTFWKTSSSNLNWLFEPKVANQVKFFKEGFIGDKFQTAYI